MEFIKNEKTVVVKSKTEWTYDGIESLKLKDLNEALYNELQKEVDYNVDNEEQIKEQQRLERIEQTKKDNEKKVSNFKELVLNNPEIMKEIEDNNLEITFRNSDVDSPIDGRYLALNKKGWNKYSCQATIEYNSRVYHSGSWSASRTDRVWELYFDYKRTRFVDLLKAVKGAVKRINESVEKLKRKQQKEIKEKFQEEEMKKFAEENGFTFEKEYHRSNYSNNVWYNYFMIKETEDVSVKARIVFDEEKYRVVIRQYTVSKKKSEISVDEINGLF